MCYHILHKNEETYRTNSLAISTKSASVLFSCPVMNTYFSIIRGPVQWQYDMISAVHENLNVVVTGRWYQSEKCTERVGHVRFHEQQDSAVILMYDSCRGTLFGIARR